MFQKAPLQKNAISHLFHIAAHQGVQVNFLNISRPRRRVCKFLISTHQYISVHISTYQQTSVHISTHQYILVHISTYISTRQYTSVHISTHQHILVQYISIPISAHQYTSVHISTYQCILIHISAPSVQGSISYFFCNDEKDIEFL